MPITGKRVSRRRKESSAQVQAWALPLTPVQILRTAAPVSMLLDRPRHPVFWPFVGVRFDGIGFGGVGTCPRMFATSHDDLTPVDACGGRKSRARAAGADIC